MLKNMGCVKKHLQLARQKVSSPGHLYGGLFIGNLEDLEAEKRDAFAEYCPFLRFLGKKDENLSDLGKRRNPEEARGEPLWEEKRTGAAIESQGSPEGRRGRPRRRQRPSGGRRWQQRGEESAG